jgi:hypothetical protein
MTANPHPPQEITMTLGELAAEAGVTIGEDKNGDFQIYFPEGGGLTFSSQKVGIEHLWGLRTYRLRRLADRKALDDWFAARDRYPTWDAWQAAFPNRRWPTYPPRTPPRSNR